MVILKVGTKMSSDRPLLWGHCVCLPGRGLLDVYPLNWIPNKHALNGIVLPDLAKLGSILGKNPEKKTRQTPRFERLEFQLCKSRTLAGRQMLFHDTKTVLGS